MALEKLIAYHCAPVLSGIKPSNIVTCDKGKILNIHKQIERLRSALAEKNVKTDILYECEKYLLLIVYRPKQLKKYLDSKPVAEFLSKYGYGEEFDFEFYIKVLKERIALNCGFPHEIGIFLGYPLADVIGFIKNNGRNCKLCGVWKVYDNVSEACCIFKKIEKCKRVYAKHFDMGKTVVQLTVAV